MTENTNTQSGGQSLTRKAGKGALWQIIGGGWHTMVRMCASMVLARMLAPADFGLFGMAIIAMGLVQYLGAFGMSAGIIVKQDVTEEDLCTYFWSMSAVRLTIFIIAYFFAPLAAAFFKDPRVTEILRAISLTFLVSILSLVASTLLTKEMKFGALNVIRGAGLLLESGLAVLLAVTTDLHYWVLVIAMLVSSFFIEFSIMVYGKWFPKFKFSKESFSYLFRYGINGFGFSITSYLEQNLDYLLVGRMLGTTSMGLYEFAYRLPHLVQEKISQPLSVVAFPALSQVQHDDNLLARGYEQVVKYVSLMSFPFLFGLAAVADVAVPLLWGEQWLPVITPLRILCLCAVLRIIPQPIGTIFNCKDRPDLPFKFALAGLGWTALAVGSLGYLYGITGVAWGMVLSLLPRYVAFLLAFAMMKRNPVRMGQTVWPILLSAVLCALGAYGVAGYMENTGLPLIVDLVCAVLTGALIYVSLFFFVFTRMFRETVNKLEEVSGRHFSFLHRGKKDIDP